MSQTLSDFVLNWDRTHENFTFSYSQAPVSKRPTSIEVRYSARDYENIYSFKAVSLLRSLVFEKSHDTMYIATDGSLLKRGIMEIKVASSSPEYREKYVVDTLKSIGEEFLRHKKTATN